MTTPTAGEPVAIEIGRLVDAHRHARTFYRDHLQLADGPRRYLTNRSLGRFAPPEVDEPWWLGYAPPGWTNLVDHLTKAGYTPTELIAAGLATRTRNGRLVDLFRDRIMLPIHTPIGEPVGFLGRAAPGAPADVPKYLNTPGTAIYHKGQILYGMGEQAEHMAAGAAPILVEGPTDVLAVALAHTDGQQVALAACGTSLTTHHADALAAMPGTARHGITVAYDNDPAGRAATDRAWNLLSANPGAGLYATALPAGADPADLITTPGGVAALRTALTERARPLAQAVIDIRLDHILTRRPDLLRFIEGRVDTARALAAGIIDLPADQVVALTSHIADRVGVAYDTVAAAVIDRLERAPPTPACTTVAIPISVDRRPRPFAAMDGENSDRPAHVTVASDRQSRRHTR